MPQNRLKLTIARAEELYFLDITVAPDPPIESRQRRLSHNLPPRRLRPPASCPPLTGAAAEIAAARRRRRNRRPSCTEALLGAPLGGEGRLGR